MTSKITTLIFMAALPLFGVAQEEGYDFLKARIRIAPDPDAGLIAGEAQYDFVSPGTGDSIRLDAHMMEYSRVELNGQPAAYRTTSGKLVIEGPEQGGRHELRISYRAFPAQTVYFIGWKDSLVGNEQIWTQGQGKDSSHWVPVVDQMQEKAEFDLTVLFDSDYQVVANGRLIRKTREGPLTRWVFDMDKPMSSYLLAFAIGRFDSLSWESASGVPLTGYYPRGESERARWTYRYTREIFEYLEEAIGIPYPWGDYKQVPVRDFLYAGMENTGATFFSDRYLVDSLGYQDQNYINVNAHELAHQWFGNLVTETGAAEHWLHEGFATFYAYEAERHLLGSDLVYWKLYDTARALEGQDATGAGESLLDPGASSLTFYEKGAWALYLLREEVGETAFRKGVKDFLQAHAYSNARVEDFLRAVEKSSGTSLSGFRKTWLEATGFPSGPAMEYLKQNAEPVKRYLGLLEAEKRGTPVEESMIAEAWQQYASPWYRAHLLRSFRDVLTPVFLEQVCRQGSLPVQKAFLETTGSLQDWMIPMVEGWLDAPSYDLREASLFRLWVARPAKRKSYLDRVSQNGSLSEMRLQQLWWLLAVFTEGYGDGDAKQGYLKRLRATTSSAYGWEIREHAFSMLREVGALGPENLQDLMQATEHHSWQFKKFARNLFEELLKEQGNPDLWKNLAENFPRDRYKYLHQKIESL
ncbi:MAG: M1 family metallopeptidase [Robiginitalea sp.]|nr:M1 family metallopeptidase [Robiginitalea sp.]